MADYPRQNSAAFAGAKFGLAEGLGMPQETLFDDDFLADPGVRSTPWRTMQAAALMGINAKPKVHRVT